MTETLETLAKRVNQLEKAVAEMTLQLSGFVDVSKPADPKKLNREPSCDSRHQLHLNRIRPFLNHLKPHQIVRQRQLMRHHKPDID